MNNMPQKSLLECQPGEVGRLRELACEGELRAKLLRLGLAPGRLFSLVQGGSRCIVCAAGAKIALHSDLARKVLVSTESTDPSKPEERRE